MENLTHDIAELELVLTRLKSKEAIEKITKAKKELETMVLAQEQKPKPVEQPQQQQQKLEQKQEPADTLAYTPIKSYSWEQEGSKVKLIFLLDGIGQVPKENIKVDFSKQSLDVKIIGYKGQNLRFAVKTLCDKIKPEQCSFTQKNNSLFVRLEKDDFKNWDQIHYKESTINPDKFDKNADPQASLMNMMKEMYQNGDEEMKKTIAETWSKTQAEKKL